MRRATVWVGVFTLVCFSCVPAPAEKENGEEPVALEVVKMKVGPTSLDQTNKLERPIPEVPFGEPFRVEVEWDSETRPNQSLTLKDFHPQGERYCGDGQDHCPGRRGVDG